MARIDPGPSSAALVQQAQTGDSRALDALWRGHRRWVAAILLAHRPAGEDLEDLLQEVALAVLRRLPELRDPERFRGWLRTVAINAARQAGRKSQTRERHVRRLPVATAEYERALEVDPPELEDGTSEVMEALDRLPPEYREPLVLRCLRGYGQRRIARELGLPETTVETRLARARRKVREALEQSRTGERTER